MPVKLDKELETLDDQIVSLSQQGHLDQAIDVAKKALDYAEQRPGADRNEYVAMYLSDLGRLYGTQKQYAQAEPLFKRALAIAEHDYGSTDLQVAWHLNNLGLLYQAQDQYAWAEPLFHRTLVITEQALNPKRPETVKLVAAALTTYQFVLNHGFRAF
jgi:tetratricopeptide (TPR) repeat protein